MSRPVFKVSITSPFDNVQNSNNVRTSTTAKNADSQFTSSDRYNLEQLNPVNVDKYIKEELIEPEPHIGSSSQLQNPYSLYNQGLNNFQMPSINSTQFQLPDIPPPKPVEQKPSLISRIFTLRNIIGFGLLAVPLFISK